MHWFMLLDERLKVVAFPHLSQKQTAALRQPLLSCSRSQLETKAYCKPSDVYRKHTYRCCMSGGQIDAI